MQTTDLVICLGVAQNVEESSAVGMVYEWGGASVWGQRKVWEWKAIISRCIFCGSVLENQSVGLSQRNVKTGISFGLAHTNQPSESIPDEFELFFCVCGLVCVSVHCTAGIKWGGKFSANFHVANLYAVIREETIYCTKRRWGHPGVMSEMIFFNNVNYQPHGVSWLQTFALIYGSFECLIAPWVLHCWANFSWDDLFKKNKWIKLVSEAQMHASLITTTLM